MLVERHVPRFLATIERRDVMALVREGLQPTVVDVGDDDSALIVDAHSLRKLELSRTRALVAKGEQEGAID